MSKIFKPKSQPEIDAEISEHFGVDNIYDNPVEQLPDYKKVDEQLRKELEDRKAIEKKIIIDLRKIKIEGTTMTIIKLIGGIIALVAAFVFTFVFPTAGAEQLVIQVVAAVLGAFGISNWRTNYGLAKDWFKSKTIVPAILVMVIIIAVTVLAFINIGLPPLVMTLLQGVVVALGGVGLWGIFDASKIKNQNLKSIIAFIIGAGTLLAVHYMFAGLLVASGVTYAAITALSGQTKAASQKTARQRSFAAKEASGDSYVTLPADCLKSVKCMIKGVNDAGAFGENSIGQEITGELIIYAAEAAIRTFCHELVTKTLAGVQLTTNSGQTYAFATADSTPALVIAYDEAMLVSDKDEPTTIKLKITGFRDNLVMS